MRDEMVLGPALGRSLLPQPEAQAIFTAYLLPVAGEPKYGARWKVLRADSDVGQAGEVLTWTAEELSEMTPEERCTAQPVFVSEGIDLSGAGPIVSPAVRVGSPGIIHWVEEIEASETLVHRGICGAPSATTVVPRARLDTAAPPTIRMGETASDTAFLTGAVSPEAGYSVRFEAFVVADVLTDGPSPAPPSPRCSPAERVFETGEIPVRAVGPLKSPGFVVDLEYAPGLRWVATLSFLGPSGRIELQRGDCGDPAETTAVELPSLSTSADAEAAVGDAMRDRARVAGLPPAREGVAWELGFELFRERRLNGAGGPAPEFLCAPENLLAETVAVAVHAPGEIPSPPVIARPEWVGRVHWVATLWVRSEGQRFEVSRGRCGDPAESTVVVASGLGGEPGAGAAAERVPSASRVPEAAVTAPREAPGRRLPRTGSDGAEGAAGAAGLVRMALLPACAGLALLLGRMRGPTATRGASPGDRQP